MMRLGHWDEAAADFAKATELAPKEGTHWNMLGVAQYRAGDWKAAVTTLNKSMELRNGGDSTDCFFLAMAHWQLGEKEEARKWYDQAVEWMEKNNPDDEELRRFRRSRRASRHLRFTDTLNPEPYKQNSRGELRRQANLSPAHESPMATATARAQSARRSPQRFYCTADTRKKANMARNTRHEWFPLYRNRSRRRARLRATTAGSSVA